MLSRTTRLTLAAAVALAATVPARAEWVNGEIVRMDAAKKRIVLRHDAIKVVTKMAPMTMGMKVKDAALMAPFHEGDRVRFDVFVEDDELVVHQIEARK